MLKSGKAIAVGLLALALAPQAAATKIAPMNLVDLVERSARIFEGRVIAINHGTVKSSDGKYDYPVVRYTFEVLDDLRGAGAKTVILSQMGFFQDGRRTRFNPDQIGIPKYELGKQYVLFMGREGSTGLCSPIGFHLGMFDVAEGKAYHRVDNRFVMNGMDKALKGTAHEALTNPVILKNGQADGLDVVGLKALIRDLMTGAIKAPRWEETKK